jgi:hypothetical protein
LRGITQIDRGSENLLQNLIDLQRGTDDLQDAEEFFVIVHLLAKGFDVVF